MAPQNFQLVMRAGPTPGKTFELSQREITIGRDVSNTIVISDAEVSRRHARLVAQSGSYLLEDLGSTNGTFVDGQRLMGPHLLQSGQTVLLGENVSMVFEAMEFDPDATIAAAYSAPRPPSEQPTRQEPAPPFQAEPYPPVSEERRAERPPERRAEPASAFPQPASPPVYSGQVPPGPVEVYDLPEDEEPRGPRRNWILGGCGCLTLLLCLTVVAVLFWIDSGGVDRWCQYLGFLFPACP